MAHQQAHPQAGSQQFGYGQGHQDLGFGRAPQQAAPQAQPQQPAFQPVPAYPAAQQGYPQQQPSQPAYYNSQPEAPQANGQFGNGQFGNGLRGSQFDQWPAPPAPADTRGFDFAAYQQQQPAPQQGYGGYPQPGPQLQAPQEWQGHDAYGAPQRPPQDMGLDPNVGYAANAGQAVDPNYNEEEDYADDEPQTSWKQQLGRVAAVLGVAIVVGIGGWTGYNYVLGGSDSKGPTPVVKNMSGPSKEKPANPGGKQFEHADSKILGRLGEGAAADNATADDGSRKVSTLTVNPDGSIKPPAVSADASGDTSAKPAGPAPTAVPGLSIVDVGGSAPPAPPAAAAAPSPAPSQKVATAQPSAPAAPAAPEKPVIISKVLPSNAPPAEPAIPSSPADKKQVAAATDKAAEAAAPKAVAKVEKKVAAVAPAGEPAATGPKPTGAGYVAVLASIPATGSSQLDALKQFADMKSKYATLLGGKTPEVQVANLGSKGTYHRLLVGPPGSQESVKELCNGLKAAGFSGCWPLAY